MNLSTVSAVKVLISASGNVRAENETEIAAVLAGVSGAVERYLDRYATRIARTVYLDIEPGQTIFRLPGVPVTALGGAWHDLDQDFASSSALSSTDYYDPTLGSADAFRTKYPLASGVACLKLTYTGGMATDTDSFVTAYPDVSHAVATQTAHEWQRRTALGVSSISYPDGTTASLSFDRWIPSVKQVLDYYRRVTFA